MKTLSFVGSPVQRRVKNIVTWLNMFIVEILENMDMTEDIKVISNLSGNCN